MGQLRTPPVFWPGRGSAVRCNYSAELTAPCFFQRSIDNASCDDREGQLVQNLLHFGRVISNNDAWLSSRENRSSLARLDVIAALITLQRVNDGLKDIFVSIIAGPQQASIHCDRDFCSWILPGIFEFKTNLGSALYSFEKIFGDYWI